MTEDQNDSFNSSRAEVFEALGHPTRMRILQTLSERPLGFSELKRETGIESGGLLTFHLGKLSDLVKLNSEGSYALTDEGREALRIIEVSKKQQEGGPGRRLAIRLPHQKAILAGALVLLVVLGSVTVYQQERIAALSNQQSKTMTTTMSSILTTTVTTTSKTTCVEPASNATKAFATNCQLGITLALATNLGVSMGQNVTVSVSLTNDLAIPENINYTGPPILPHGPDLTSTSAVDYMLPIPPSCGYPSVPTYEPAFIVLYNGSGSPMHLSNSPPSILDCISSLGQFSHPFEASQTISETLSIGGYWTSPNGNEPWVNATYSQFSPSHYTVVAFDPWGQFTELNFTVSPA